MLTAEMNERLTRVGPGTPMGETLRRYWLPAALSEELPDPDCPPIRVQLLGENLVAFRDTSGDVGLLDAHCPHRRAPLFLGRNEECGLRCVYHGWKFDTAGNCVDLPSEPPDSLFRNKVNITAYPTWEAGGVVWAFMGPRAEMPPLPDYEWLRAQPGYQRVSKVVEHANFLQGIEGGIDTSHSSFVHNNDLSNQSRLKSRNTHPTLEVDKTDYGFRYAGIRTISQDRDYVRAYQFIMPFHQMRASLLKQDGEPKSLKTIRGHLWVPMNDEWTTVFNLVWGATDDDEVTPEEWQKYEEHAGRGLDDYVPGTYRLRANETNDWLIDREVQRRETFTGISGLNTQDFAVQEGMGPICDRTRETLGTSDKAIIAARKLMREATERTEEGKPLPGTDPEAYQYVRPAEDIVDRSLDWRDALKEKLTAYW